MTRKDMGADLRANLDAMVNKQIAQRGARKIEALVTAAALLLACMMATALCHCGGVPFTSADLALASADGSTLADGTAPPIDGAAPMGDAALADGDPDVVATGGKEAASDAGADADPPSADADAQAPDAAVCPYQTCWSADNGTPSGYQACLKCCAPCTLPNCANGCP